MPIQQITVYADVVATETLSFIDACARKVCPDHTIVVTPADARRATSDEGMHVTGDLESQQQRRSSLIFMKLWEKEVGEVETVVHSPFLFMERCECFITDCQGLSSGEVAYAVHRRQMPVLSLDPCIDNNGRRGKNTILEKLLYTHWQEPPHTVVERVEATNSAEQAIATFLSYAATVGKVAAIESDDMELALKACRNLPHRRFQHGVPLEKDTVMVVGSDGFPIAFDAAESSATTPSTPALLPAPPPTFHLLQEMLAGAVAADAADTSAVAGKYYSLLLDCPQLHGALFVFNRYQNRGMLRYLLQKGCSVLFVNHSFAIAEELARVLQEKLPQKDVELHNELLRHLTMLRRFEGHWLEMPLPLLTLHAITASPAETRSRYWWWEDFVSSGCGLGYSCEGCAEVSEKVHVDPSCSDASTCILDALLKVIVA